MIKVHFTIKRRRGPNKEVLGKVSSIGLHFIEQPDVLQGVVRLTSLKSDTFKRLKNKQTVITPDGLGTIQDYTEKIIDNVLVLPDGVNVRVRPLNKKKRYYNLGNLYVIDIIESKTGFKYPVIQSDYPYLAIDDAPVEFVTDLSKTAQLSIATRRQLDNIPMFTKKQNGPKILNELIEKKIWDPTKK